MAEEKDEDVFKELASSFDKMRLRSAPTEAVIEEQALTADQEDTSQGFDALARRRRWEKWSEKTLPAQQLEVDFNVRVRVKPDHLQVAWKDHRGINGKSDVFEISMHGVKFHCPGTEPSAINALIFPRSDVTLGIKNAEFFSMEGDFAIFRLVEFTDNVDNWMTWIEKLSRVNKE